MLLTATVEIERENAHGEFREHSFSARVEAKWSAEFERVEFSAAAIEAGSASAWANRGWTPLATVVENQSEVDAAVAALATAFFETYCEQCREREAAVTVPRFGAGMPSEQRLCRDCGGVDSKRPMLRLFTEESP